MADSPTDRLIAEDLTLGYGGDDLIVTDLSLAIPDDEFTVIIGPNACGKSTLLKALARVLAPRSGVILDGKAISEYPPRVAKILACCRSRRPRPKTSRVAELVARGRFPPGFLRNWSKDDERIVAEALAATGTTALSDQRVDQLSGGQRQRVWVAMVLAQQTPLVLLDEPTTFLDIAHQIELLELCRSLNREQGRTVVAVLHDLNQACRYADFVVAMRDGKIVAQGRPADVVTEGRRGGSVRSGVPDHRRPRVGDTAGDPARVSTSGR